ncbi:TOMM precursor leader peptide-binding protein [Streptomyces sp. NPDC057743]|uniref:TOMM precursor leader peptide-binding protein n=1 Tax=Streptomyces sp. NPDC057743 TaxID=3346236 RepID=UPI0036C6DEE9
MPEQVIEAVSRAANGPASVLGSGPLADALRRRPLPQGPTVFASDTWDGAEASRLARHRGGPVLPVLAEPGQVVVGPLVAPGRAGCPTCVDRRAWRRTPQRRADAAVRAQASPPAAGRPMPSGGLLGAVLERVVATWDRWEAASTDVPDADGDRGPAPRPVVVLDRRTLRLTIHRVLPEPGCPVCGDLPDDSPERAVVPLTSRPTGHPGGSRQRALDPAQLVRTYLDPLAGVVPEVSLSMGHGLPFAEAPVVVPGTHDLADGPMAEFGYGRTTTFDSCRDVAVTEGLERLAGQLPRGKRTVVRGSYRELAEHALDPRRLGLPPQDELTDDGPFHRYHPELALPWVWGYSLTTRRPVLVPEQFAYYGRHRLPGAGPRIAYEISNGCALGSSLEEAALHGLLEVAERDAFLLTWYTRMTPPRIDLTRCGPDVRLIEARIRHRHGCRVHAFATTVDNGVPTFWVMAEDTTGDPDRPRVVCTGGSSLVPEDGLLGALHELSQTVDYIARQYAAERDRARELTRDPDQVMTLLDHVLASATPEARPRFDFLFDRGADQGEGHGEGPGQGHGEPVAPQELAGLWWRSGESDLTASLTALVARFADCGQEVVVVDQSSAEHLAGGFRAVKVLVTGALPMVFGHRRQRFADLPRLATVPVALGRRATPLTRDEINPHPHPFP